ncbi:SusC/RagA family TonB-linked outer membrane protein [Parapedobacter tibetensis]|uniref:SusC/RagA family TonB-linked outer membrane protein n=1 Tax=Parapedobacter tibetensis TaxID=2972951 RepID=UPI00214DEE3C|nr:SusC/RagA family TonB-linked outer membrane protein [Parapedobacter tibetensis]
MKNLSRKLPASRVHRIQSRLLLVLWLCLLALYPYDLSANIPHVRNPTMAQVLSGKIPGWQQKNLEGKIVTESGDPVVATVAVKGSSVRTTSSESGEFELKNVPIHSILVITALHIETTEFEVEENANVLIVVKRTMHEVEEVVINTGYQELHRERATGSFGYASNETLNLQTGTNILERLNGVVNGVQFTNPYGRENQIRVRGLSTINGPQDVLIVLDNFPYEGNINNINPNDIESVSVLKDAAAASIWGARAANGVIVINTKKGRPDSGPKIELNSTLTMRNKQDLYYLPAITSAEYIDMEHFLFERGYYDNDISNGAYFKTPLTPAVNVLLKARNGLISATDSRSEIARLKGIDSREEYLKSFYTNSGDQQYAINLSGGGQRSTYLVSMAYDRSVDDTYGKDRRLNLRLMNTHSFSSKVQLSVSALYNQATGESGRPGFNSIRVNNRIVPYLRFADDDGTPLSVETTLQKNYTDTAGRGLLLPWGYLPLEDYKHHTTSSIRSEIVGNAGLKYSPIPELTISAQYQYQQQNSRERNLRTAESFYARDLINRFSQVDGETGAVNHIVPLGGVLQTGGGSVASSNFRLQTVYDRTWDSHDVALMAGAEVRQVKSDAESNTIFGYSEDPLVSMNADLVNRYPEYITGQPTLVPGGASFSNSLNRSVSFYANLAYTFRNTYTFSASARRDAANIFGQRTNDRWNPLWSVGAAWNISSESFYRLDMLPFLRIRATYGFAGNIDPTKTPHTLIGYVNSIDNYYHYFPWADVSLGDNALRWEKTGTLNIGADFSSSNGVVSGSLDVYQKKGTDLYGPTFYDYTLYGLTAHITKNVADMKGYGYELTVKTRNLQHALVWNSTFIINYLQSKTTKYNIESATKYASLIGNGRSINPVVGKPLYAIASYRWAGLDTEGNPQGYAANEPSTNYQLIMAEASSQEEAENIVFHGSSVPTLQGAIGNELSYKGVTLTAYLAYRLGYYYRKPSLSYSQLFNQGYGHKEYAERWEQPGDEQSTHVPAMVYPADSRRDAFYSLSEIHVERADNLKLQFVSLSYRIDAGKRQRYGLDVYVNASNLGILWKSSKGDIDPDYPSTIPAPRSFAIGMRLNIAPIFRN